MRRFAAATPPHEPDLMDEVIDCYVIWRECRNAVRDAYSVWDVSSERDRDRSFQTYVAALDREQAAAEEYEELVIRAGTQAQLTRVNGR